MLICSVTTLSGFERKEILQDKLDYGLIESLVF